MKETPHSCLVTLALCLLFQSGNTAARGPYRNTCRRGDQFVARPRCGEAQRSSETKSLDKSRVSLINVAQTMRFEISTLKMLSRNTANTANLAELETSNFFRSHTYTRASTSAVRNVKYFRSLMRQSHAYLPGIHL